MEVAAGQRAEVVTSLASSLQAAGLSTQVIADESSWARKCMYSSGASSTLTVDSVLYAVDEPQWLNPTVGQSLGANAHHLYDFSAASVQETGFAAGRVLSGGGPTWFTEICCEDSASSDEREPDL